MGLVDFSSKTKTATLLIVSLVTTLVVLHSPDFAAAEVHVVGGDDGWTSSMNYLKWSQGRNFTVGDVLVFNYVKGQHDAVEVTEETFQSCEDDGSGVVKRYESGNDRVVLEAPARRHWFICSFSGHCLAGMKLAVDVNNGGGASVQSTTNNATAPPGTTYNGAFGTRRHSTSYFISATLLVLVRERNPGFLPGIIVNGVLLFLVLMMVDVGLRKGGRRKKETRERVFWGWWLVMASFDQVDWI
ncbi:hypothetical protein H6P81_018639 [Aristolochia fimbriata]|uniref:Phytocyanin domain-containing protein n=1 Tax=Aristolochia fimbriata TaxID=158543 RepID=A0AAV7E1L9_ARIFI|nr:hypothetical protein H6P81_018639 [Aristolochia fimbriata]